MKGASKAIAFSMILTMALTLCAGALNFVNATPTTPQSYYGILKINGVNAPAGTGIKAMINGEDRTFGGSYSTSVSGNYGSSGPEGKFYVSGSSDDNGMPVVFMVEKTPGSGNYAEANEQGSFNPGAENTHLDLTVTIEEECTDGETRPCYTGPAGTQDVGICHGGTENCVSGEWSGVCSGEQLPEAELCDGMDNNCDGNTDETWETILGTPCSAGIGACYAEGVFVCDSSQTGTECNAVPGVPSAEACNGIDDDCDTETDEGLGQTTCGLGVCEHTVDNCAGGVEQVCNPFEGASTEVCNDMLDNDCDGLVDCDDTADCDGNPLCESTGGDYCIVINSVRILDNTFTEVTEILPGRMYNVEVTNENTCTEPIKTMQIVQISKGSTPRNIGTVTTWIDGGETSVITVGFTMSQSAVPGTEYKAEIFNWNHWISYEPDTFEILSEPAEKTFTVGSL